MKKKVVLVLMVSCVFIVWVGADQNNQMEIGMGMEGLGSKTTQIIEAVKTLYSLPTISYHWILRNFKPLQQQAPNLDFRERRSSSSVDENKDGATKKVKEAVMKSLDKSKATVEDTAKSAAKFAEETLEKAVKKLKKTLSGKPKVGAEL